MQLKCSSVDSGSVCNDLCHRALESVKGEGGGLPLYSRVSTYTNIALEVWIDDTYHL